MIRRNAHKILTELACGFYIVAVTGPRQSGKTTLVQYSFPEKQYVSLEDPDERDFAQQDPRRFLGRFPTGAILDEVQRCPELFSYLQSRVDADRQPGQFILTGSQQFGLLKEITQSLAGRVGMAELLPFTLQELQAANCAPQSVDRLLLKGLYPPLYDRKLQPTIWYKSYVQTYVERDLRLLTNVKDLSTFQRFLRMCAARVGQLVNFSSLANECGITHNTAKSWISILESSYLVFLLKPHYKNYNKRLVKTPKLYFHDTGLAACLLNIYDEDQLSIHPARGALFENWVLSEYLKKRFNQGQESNLYFWRDNTGNEVDLILDQGDKLIPIEIKSGQTLSSDSYKGLYKWLKLAGNDAASPVLIYGGSSGYERTGITVLPWNEVP